MYHLDDQGGMIPYTESPHDDFEHGDDQELRSMPTSFLSSNHDYVSRARYLVGNQTRTPTTTMETRRAIAKLERATMELRQGLLS